MPEDVAGSLSQSSYQVRLEWGAEGMRRLAASHLVVVADVFGATAAALASLEAGESVEATPAVRALAAGGASTLVLGGLRNAAAVARWVLDEQTRRGERTSVAIIALPAADGRFAVENQLGAGAVVAALGDLGIDHCSPDAAVAGEGFRALRGAARHLLTASGSGRELAAAGRKDDVLFAAAHDAASLVPVWRDGVFVAA